MRKYQKEIQDIIRLLENSESTKLGPLSNPNIRIDSKAKLREKYWIDTYKDLYKDLPVAFQAGHREGFCSGGDKFQYPEIDDEHQGLEMDAQGHLTNIQELEFSAGFQEGQKDWQANRRKFQDWANSYSASLVAYDSVKKF